MAKDAKAQILRESGELLQKTNPNQTLSQLHGNLIRQSERGLKPFLDSAHGISGYLPSTNIDLGAVE